mgnify:CR=1 FL=1
MSSIAYQIHIASENALIIYFGDKPGLVASTEIAHQIQQAKQEIEHRLADVLLDLVPSYASLLVVFDPMLIDHYQLRHMIRTQLKSQKAVNISSSNVIELPVYYGDDVALDLTRIANHSGLSPAQIIDIHQQQTYRVFAIGFAPGFGYLGEVDERIAMARLDSPRANVPKGAVGIADRQTAIYPAASPGGWNIIGRCPILMFDPTTSPSMPFNVGDEVRFKAINKTTFLELGGVLT